MLPLEASPETATSVQLLTSTYLLDVGSSVTFTASVITVQGPAIFRHNHILRWVERFGIHSIDSAGHSVLHDELAGRRDASDHGGLCSSADLDRQRVLAADHRSMAIGANPAPSDGLLFVPVNPCRVMDTRGNGFWLLRSAQSHEYRA